MVEENRIWQHSCRNKSAVNEGKIQGGKSLIIETKIKLLADFYLQFLPHLKNFMNLEECSEGKSILRICQTCESIQ